MTTAGADKIDWTQPIQRGDQSLTLDQWAQRLGVTPKTLQNRIRDFGLEKALSFHRMSSGQSGRRGGGAWKRRYSQVL